MRELALFSSRCSLAFSLLLATAVLAAGQTARLAGVRAIGSQHFAEVDIVRATGLKLGTEVSVDELQEAADRLAASGAFMEVAYQYVPKPGALTVEFRVTDSSLFLPVEFDNFVWLSDEELGAELRSRVPLFTGQLPSGGNLVEQVAIVLQGILRERGIAGQVAYFPQGRQGGPIEGLLYRLQGIVSRVRELNFLGAVQLDLKLLEAASQPLLEGDYQRSFVRSFAVENLRPLYWQRGYLRVQFGKPQAEIIEKNPDAPAVRVSIPVQEGIQYSLAEIRWSGNSVFSSAEMMQQIHLVPGRPANALQLEQDVERVHTLYGTKGYLRAVVHPEATFDDAQRTVAYTLDVAEGALYRMGKLEITGLDPARLQRLHRGWQLAPGEPFDVTYLNRFFNENARQLPPDIYNWRLNLQTKINEITKTVDVQINFQRKPGA